MPVADQRVAEATEAEPVAAEPAAAEPVAAKPAVDPIPAASATDGMRHVDDDNFGPYCVQIGAFLLPEAAQRRIADLAGIGVEAIPVIAPAHGKIYQRVYVPNLTDADEAYSLGRRVKSELGFAYLVRKEY